MNVLKRGFTYFEVNVCVFIQTESQTLLIYEYEQFLYFIKVKLAKIKFQRF